MKWRQALQRARRLVLEHSNDHISGFTSDTFLPPCTVGGERQMTLIAHAIAAAVRAERKKWNKEHKTQKENVI